MSGLGAGLARGLAAYGQGRMVAEDREAQRQQQEAERKRQAARDALMIEQFNLQKAQFDAGQKQIGEQNKIAAEGRTNTAIGNGFRPVGDQWDTFNDMVGIDPSKAETISVNGQPMRKVAPTQQFQDGMRQKREQDATLAQQAQAAQESLAGMQAQLNRIKPGLGALARDPKSAQALLTRYAEQSMAPPRQESPVNMQVIQTADGPMAFNPRTGRAEPITANGQRVTQAAPVGRMTEGQRRAAGLLSIAEKEASNLENIGTPGPWDRAMAKVPFGLGDGLMTDQGQRFMGAGQAFARPYLYTVSGAAASDKEADATARAMIPGPFTRSAADKDMRTRRQTMLDGMRTIANQPGGGSPLEDPEFLDFLRSKGIVP